MSDVMTLIPRDEYKQLKAENQRLRGLLERARALQYVKPECNCVVCELHREIEEELGDGE